MSLIITAILLLTTAVRPCATYEVLSVGGQNCGIFGPESALAWGMSSSGHMLAGQSTTCQVEHFGFSWEPAGALVPLQFPVSTTYSRAYDVNQDGMVVGEVDADGEGGRRGFRSQAGNTVFLQPDEPGMASALAVNNSGLVVGSANGGTLHAMYWIRTKGVSLEPQLPLGPNSTALDVNDIGQICGWMGGNGNPHPDFPSRAFIWHNGKTITLPIAAHAAGDWAVATALNNRGDACGYFFITHPEKEFVRRACAWIDGEFIDLSVLSDADGSLALDINDAREIIGYCTSGPSGNIQTGFIWRCGVMHDLHDFIPTGIFGEVVPTAINSTGQIAGGARLLPDNDGVAFRLTPALPLVPGDTDCSGTVNIDDLLTVIGHWNSAGPVGGDPADVNRDNRIDIEDLLQVLSNWTR